jgi:arginine decarboxylase
MKTIGNKIPYTFFVTKGSGVSEYAVHPGSYHMALHDAGISQFNIVNYSSVLPATSKLVSLDEIDLPPFGSELNTIMACAHGYYGEHISAGIIHAWMYTDDTCEEKVGGIVCELSGYFDTETLEKRLYMIMDDLYNRTFNQYYLGEPTVTTESITIDKRYGTALVALCFVDYLIDIN